jgi:hypothetical protein
MEDQEKTKYDGGKLAPINNWWKTLNGII